MVLPAESTSATPISVSEGKKHSETNYKIRKESQMSMHTDQSHK